MFYLDSFHEEARLLPLLFLLACLTFSFFVCLGYFVAVLYLANNCLPHGFQFDNVNLQTNLSFQLQ